jgi:hypothetical protein
VYERAEAAQEKSFQLKNQAKPVGDNFGGMTDCASFIPRAFTSGWSCCVLCNGHSTCPKSRKPVIDDREWALIRNLRDYFLPDFFFAVQ